MITKSSIQVQEGKDTDGGFLHNPSRLVSLKIGPERRVEVRANNDSGATAETSGALRNREDGFNDY